MNRTGTYVAFDGLGEKIHRNQIIAIMQHYRRGQQIGI